MADLTLISRAAVLEGFAPAAQAAGLDPLWLLARHSLPPNCLTDPDLPIPTAKVISLIEDAAEIARMPDFGLAMSEVRNFGTLGAVGLVMREQPDLRGALARLIDFGWVQVDGLQLRLEEVGDIAVLDLLIASSLPRPAAQSIELTLASITRLLRGLLGLEWQPDMVLCEHPRPASVATHLRHFRQVPVFSADRNALVLRAEDLSRKIVGADPGAERAVERYLALVAGTRSESHSARAERMIQQLLPRGQCRVDVVATHFGIDRRTLHRRLAREGTSFSQVVERVRLAMLESAQASARSKTALADLLGFSCLSAFSRWSRKHRLT